MKYLSICSGIEAASCAWHPLGWQPVAFSEIEPFPSAVLAARWPGVPNLGDMTQFQQWPDYAIDLLVGGTPCQGFSIAGLRGGLDDPRSRLSITYVEIAAKYRARWLVWENVPGVLSINDGADFAAFLGALTGRTIRVPDDGWRNSGVIEGIGTAYGIAWRMLDAQYAGLAQRRERVFVVGYLGDWRRAAAVLFERHSLQGNPPPRRETGKDVAGTLGSSFAHRGYDDRGDTGGVAPIAVGATTGAVTAAMGNGAMGAPQVDAGMFIAHALRGEGFDASEDGTGRGTPLVAFDPTAGRDMRAYSDGTIAFGCKEHAQDAGEVSPPLRAMGHDKSHANGGGQIAVAFQEAQTGVREYESAGTLRANGPGHDPVGTRLRIGMQVRRLTPRECERLQGFPDDYTLIEYRGKPAKDGPRYKALGNSMAVPCMAWIGRRIALVDHLRLSTPTNPIATTP